MSRGQLRRWCGRRGCTNEAVVYVERDGITVVTCGPHSEDGEVVGHV